MKIIDSRNCVFFHGLTAACAALLGLGLEFTSPKLIAAEMKLPLKNVGMEEGNDSPAGWEKSPLLAGVEQIWDRTIAHGGSASLSLKKNAQRFFPVAQWSQRLAVNQVDKPRKLRVRCWVKAENATKAIIDVTYQANQPGHVWAVFLGQKQQTDPAATHDWRLCEGVVQFPGNVTSLGIAFQIYGPGQVWFDDLDVAWLE